jgi:hypothetical protein
MRISSRRILWKKPGHAGWWSGLGLAAATALMLFTAPAGVLAQDATEPAAVNATTWYVNGAGGTDGNCNTASAPCRTIQAAVDRAASGDTILVAGNAGGIVYTFGGSNSCMSDLGADAVVCIANKKLTLRGGYAPGNFTAYAPAQNRTIIDGQGQYRGLVAQGYGNVGGTTLDMSGFVVRNSVGTFISKRSGPGADFAFGGGMRIESVGALTLRDMLFDANRAVGADRTSAVGGTGGGGGLYVGITAAATLQNVQFTNNVAQGGSGGGRGGYGQGGAILATQSTLTLDNVVFEKNIARAGNTGGAGEVNDRQRADAHGGATAFYTNSKVTFNNVTARNNQAIGGNAATYAGGGFGGALYGEVVQVTINGADIRSNISQGGTAENGHLGSGGGIMFFDSTLNVNRAVIVANVAQGGTGRSGQWGGPNGGGISVSGTQEVGSNFTLANSIVAANKALRTTGAQAMGGGGGGLWIQASNALLDHVTIADNQLGGGNGLSGAGVLLLETGSRASSVTFRNSLITGHNGGDGSAVEVFRRNTATFSGGIFFNNSWNTSRDNPNMSANSGTINGANTMTNADPQYVAPGNLDYHLKSSSPARNKAAGSQQTVDVDNDPRSDGSPDYGADEYVNREPQGLPAGRVRLFMPRIAR